MDDSGKKKRGGDSWHPHCRGRSEGVWLPGWVTLEETLIIAWLLLFFPAFKGSERAEGRIR